MPFSVISHHRFFVPFGSVLARLLHTRYARQDPNLRPLLLYASKPKGID